MVLPSANRYRAKAAECEQKAQEATDPEVKRNYAKLARQWRELAEQVELQLTILVPPLSLEQMFCEVKEDRGAPNVLQVPDG